MAVWTEYVVATFVYNLQILPETLICGLIILGILLANQPLVAVAMGLGITQLLTQGMGTILQKMAPDSATGTTSLDSCSTGFVGKSWARLLSHDPATVWHPNAPSIYMVTIGFLTGWGAALQQLYKDEIDAGIVKRPMLVALSIVGAVVLLLALTFRIYSGCESYLSAGTGTVLGLLFGFLGCISLGYATNRRGTNIWGIPLLRKK